MKRPSHQQDYQTEMLSGPPAAVTVQRLRTGAEATKNSYEHLQGHALEPGAGRGTERTNGCTGRKAWLLSATRLTRAHVSQ